MAPPGSGREGLGRPDEVTASEERRGVEADPLVEAFAPHSLTVMEVELG